ncbi:MAG: Alpha-glucoside transport system permease protein AglG, partial [uncultured Nocardioides sp.]
DAARSGRGRRGGSPQVRRRAQALRRADVGRPVPQLRLHGGDVPAVHPVDRPDPRPAGDVVPRPHRRLGGGVVDRAPQPLRRRLDHPELPRRLRRHRHRVGVHQQPGRGHPGHGDPDHVRRLRGVRLHVHGLPRQGRPVRGDRGGHGGAHPGGLPADAQPAGSPRARPHRAVLRGVAAAHRLRHATGHLHAAQLHGHPPQDGHRVRQDRRGVALPDVLAAHRADVGAGPGRVRHPAVPVGVERPARRQAVPRVVGERHGHRGAPGPHRDRWSGQGAADRRRLHLDGAPHGGVLRPAAVLRPRTDVRSGEGI